MAKRPKNKADKKVFKAALVDLSNLHINGPLVTVTPNKKLTPKQERFCEEFLIDLNGTQAAIRAGYGVKRARITGAELVAKRNIWDRIEALKAERSERTGITAAMVLNEFARIAFCDISQIFKEDGSLKDMSDIPEDARRAIAGIEIVEEFEDSGEDRKQIGYTKKIKFWDKPKALENLGKHLGIYLEDNKQQADTLAALMKRLTGGKDASNSDD
jgi:phage terminase small subunit